VKGLTKAFSESDVEHPRTQGVEACRSACYSNLLCQYWQYYLEDGCWLEEPFTDQAIEYPLTTRIYQLNAGKVIAGEYIQHICPGLSWTPSEEWKLVASSTSCSGTSSKDLAGNEAVSLADCKLRASADTFCGTQLVSNGLACSCILKGQLCTRQASTYGFALYELQNLRQEEVPAANGFQVPSVAPKVAASADAKAFSVMIEMKGFHYGSLQAIYAAEASFERRCVAAIKEATGASSPEIKDSDGVEGQVSALESNQTGGDVAVYFDMDVPQGKTPAEISNDLWSDDFKDSLKAIAHQTAPAAITGPLTPSIRFYSTQAWAVPGQGMFGWTAWQIVILIVVILVCIFGSYLLYKCWSRGKLGVEAEDLCGMSDDSDVDERRRSKRDMLKAIFRHDRK